MTPLRIGFDMDGVVADFASAFHGVELRLFGPASHLRPSEPEAEEAAQTAGEAQVLEESDARAARGVSAHETRRRQDAVWREIESTPNFWQTLTPTDPSAVRRIHELMLQHGWEVVFITQRPRTAGDTVQRQSQRWLVEHGFDLPSVLVISGSRGGAARALRLDYHVDDSPRHCLDIIADSSTRAILIAPERDEASIQSARKLGIGTVPGIADALNVLDQASRARLQPSLLARIATMVGWR